MSTHFAAAEIQCYTTDMQKDMITIVEAAKRLGVTRQWIYKLCADGRIPAAKRYGRQWVVPAGKLEVLPLPRPSRTIEIPRVRKKARRAEKP